MRGLAILGFVGACSFAPGSSSGSADARVIDGASGDQMTGDGATDGPISDAAVDGQLTMLICPTSYTITRNGTPNSKYRLDTASRTWEQAADMCRGDSASPATARTHLIVLDDDAERVWAFDQHNSDQWLGQSDRIAEGAFIPVTNQPVYFVGAAAGNNPSRDCLLTKATQTEVEQCDMNGHPFFCECDLFTVQDANF
jgi:hypothetical protein